MLLQEVVDFLKAEHVQALTHNQELQVRLPMLKTTCVGSMLTLSSLLPVQALTGPSLAAMYCKEAAFVNTRPE